MLDEGILVMLNDEGVAEVYDDTWDITIHCNSQEEHKHAIKMLEKQNAKKIEEWYGQASCPCCQKVFGPMETVKKLIHWEMPYCKYCGQALDWGE